MLPTEIRHYVITVYSAKLAQGGCRWWGLQQSVCAAIATVPMVIQGPQEKLWECRSSESFTLLMLLRAALLAAWTGSRSPCRPLQLVGISLMKHKKARKPAGAQSVEEST